MPVRVWVCRKARTSSSASARPRHCTWFFRKIWTTPQPSSAPRSRARGSPPAIDMWAPRLSCPAPRRFGIGRARRTPEAGGGAAAAERRPPPRPVARRSGELPDLSEDLFRIGELALAVPLDEADHPVSVDDEGRAIAGVQLRPVDPVLLHHLAVDVAEERVRDPAQRLRPRLVAVDRVRGDTHDLGIRPLEVPQPGLEGGHLPRSPRGPVEHVEEEDHLVLPLLLGQTPLLAADPLELDLRGRFSDL